MKKLFFTSFKIISLILIGFVAGAYIGFRAGFETQPFLDAVPKGLIAAIQLQALNHNDQRPARLFLETDVNQSLYAYSLLRESWWYSDITLNLLGYSPMEYDGYITRIVRYRIKNPDIRNDDPSLDPTIFDVVPPDKQEYADEYKNLAKTQRDRVARIKEVIRMHSGS